MPNRAFSPRQRDSRVLPAILFFAAGTLIALVLPAHRATARRLITKPVAAQIEAYIGPKPEGITTIATWNVLTAPKQEVTLNVTNLRVVSGNVAYFNLISAFEPYRVPFRVIGDKDLLAQITTAPPGKKLRLSGNFVLSTIPGNFMLSQVEAMETPTPAAGQ